VARQYDLGFIPVQDELYDFVVPRVRRQRQAVETFCKVLRDPSTRAELAALGFKV
jgi:putative molybdopterin biosynthesis protein